MEKLIFFGHITNRIVAWEDLSLNRSLGLFNFGKIKTNLKEACIIYQ